VLKGKVKWFGEKKAYGFITLEDGRDAFVYYDAIEGEGFRTLIEGEDVEVEVEESEKGLKATKVVRLGTGKV